jgi:mevalonate kinase
MDTNLSLLKPSPRELALHYSASSPGSLMLFGEHAVLRGKLALTAAINRRIHVTIIPRNDDVISISSALGTHTTTMSIQDAHPQFRFVIETLKAASPLPSGCDITIDSEFSHLFGFGSSAAVTVAMQGALNLWMKSGLTKEQIFHKALSVVRAVQGVASGADVAASLFGSCIAYRMCPLSIEPLGWSLPLTAVYSGSKMPTVQVIEYVNTKAAQNPLLYEQLFALMDSVSCEAKNHPERLGPLFCLQQGLMEALGVSNNTLSAIAYMLREKPGISGSKISGSGLGDCVIGLGRAEFQSDYPVVCLSTSDEGLLYA